MPRSHKKSKESKKDIKTDVSQENDESAALAANLYKKNIELLVTNKTLSLLSKLYEISILTLKPEELAVRVCQTVQVDLSFELVGIFTFESKSDSLVPLAFSKSERVKATLEKLNFSFEDLKIPGVSTLNFFKHVVHSKEEKRTNNLEEVWGDLIDPEKLQKMASEDHIKTTLLYPLTIESKILGAIMFALNRGYEELSSFEKESIKSFVNVVSLALEKAFLYQDLERANVYLRELDRQKDELISIVSHQLASPMTGLVWGLQSMEDGDLGKISEEQKQHVHEMIGTAEGLSDLTRTLLDVSRIELGKLKMDRSKTDLNTFFGDLLPMIVDRAKQKNVKFHSDIPKLPEGFIDPRLTRMTFENLLVNAVKYTPEKGKVDFTVTLEGSLLRCEIADTGYGIPKAEQGKIFSKLFRASNVEKIEGNGFGLYVAKGGIEQQGGTIRFESEEGKGTTFFVDLPIGPPSGNTSHA